MKSKILYSSSFLTVKIQIFWWDLTVCHSKEATYFSLNPFFLVSSVSPIFVPLFQTEGLPDVSYLPGRQSLFSKALSNMAWSIIRNMSLKLNEFSLIWL